MKKLSRAVPIILAAGLVVFVAPPLTAQTIEGAGETYSSQKVRRDLGEKGKIVIESLELNEADINDVVRLLAQIAGINIITGDIRGSITVYLEDVRVEDALDAILKSQGYGFIFDGNIARVVEASQLGEDRVQTITETFILNYLPAQTVAQNLRNVFQGAMGGSSFSQIEANVEANAIIAVEIPSRMEDIRRLIQILDRQFEQVEIEGRFVEISYTQDQQWGIDWQYFQDPANTLDVNLAPAPLDANNVAGQFKFAIINGDDNLNGFIQMLETTNDINILANPKILTLENKEAIIELVDEIPFVEANISQGVITESVQFQETGIRLVVTPQIAQEPDATFVRMQLELEQRIPGPNVVLQNSVAFPIDSRRALTELIVPDEATVIIGGLKSNDLSYTYEKIPFLGSIPVLGLPFRRRAKTDDQTELILFVTPRVIYEHPPLDYKEHELHEKIDHVVDGLETQEEWRERAESPVETVDKAIMYSGVECNDEKYDRMMRMKDTIEGVKPYKVSKPKGFRKVKFEGETVVVEPLEEILVEELESERETEVRDFSVIEKEAGPGGGKSGATWFGEEEEGEDRPLPPPPPPVQPPPSVEPQPAPQDQDRERPSWLRRGARHGDSGEVDEPPIVGEAEEGEIIFVTSNPDEREEPAGETYDASDPWGISFEGAEVSEVAPPTSEAKEAPQEESGPASPIEVSPEETDIWSLPADSEPGTEVNEAPRVNESPPEAMPIGAPLAPNALAEEKPVTTDKPIPVVDLRVDGELGIHAPDFRSMLSPEILSELETLEEENSPSQPASKIGVDPWGPLAIPTSEVNRPTTGNASPIENMPTGAPPTTRVIAQKEETISPNQPIQIEPPDRRGWFSRWFRRR